MPSHISTCVLCEATCGILVETENQHIKSIRGDKQDPFSNGYICPKAAALADLHNDPDRLRRPVQRTTHGWKELPWDTAFDLVAQGIKDVRRRHGRDSLATYSGNPSTHNLGILTWGQIFLRTLGCRRKFSATSADQLPHMLAAYKMLGNQLLFSIPDIDRSQYVLMLGANPLASNGSLMTAPNIKQRLKTLQQRGGKLIVIDPRRTQTAAMADRHHFIVPGTDALLLGAMVHTLFAENLVNLKRLYPFVAQEDISAIRKQVRDLSPKTVCARVGIAAEAIVEISRDFAMSPSAVCYGRMGTSTQAFGGVCAWLIQVINILTGNLDAPGGSMFTTPAIDLAGLAARYNQLGSFGRFRSRVRQLPEFGGELPVATMAEEIETAGDGQIRALFTIAGNPVLSIPNGARLDRALEGLNFMVSVDHYINETTRHANIILPPVSPLERDHYDLVFNSLAVRNVAKYSPAVLRASPLERQDWQIFQELTLRMGDFTRPLLPKPFAGLAKPALRTLLRPALAQITPKRITDLALRYGPYKLSLKALAKHPHGLDLGALEPRLPEVLRTQSQQIALCPTEYCDDMLRLQKTLSEPAETEETLQLIGRRHLRSNNSWMHNSPRLVKGKPRCTLLMHPDDASHRNVDDGAVVTIASRAGSAQIVVQVSDEVMPGVVSMPHGWGHTRDGIQMAVAQSHPGISINDITDELHIDALSGNAAFSGVRVTVTQ